MRATPGGAQNRTRHLRINRERVVVHELAVCQALLDQVADVAVGHGASSVSRITVRVGPLSGVQPHLLERAFTVARAGGIAARAELVIEAEPVRIHCRRCGGEHETDPNRLRCPDCGHAPVQLIGGDALVLTSLALERHTPATIQEEAPHV